MMPVKKNMLKSVTRVFIWFLIQSLQNKGNSTKIFICTRIPYLITTVYRKINKRERCWVTKSLTQDDLSEVNFISDLLLQCECAK